MQHTLLSTPPHLYTSIPLHLTYLHLHTSTLPYLYTSHLHTSTPPYLYTSIPLHLHTSTPPYLYTSIPLTQVSIPLHLHTSYTGLHTFTLPHHCSNCVMYTTGLNLCDQRTSETDSLSAGFGNIQQLVTRSWIAAIPLLH